MVAAAAAAAVAEAASAAEAEANGLERAMAERGEGGSSGAAGPSEASEVAEVPDHYMCPITAEIMSDPVSTVRRSTLYTLHPSFEATPSHPVDDPTHTSLSSFSRAGRWLHVRAQRHRAMAQD